MSRRRRRMRIDKDSWNIIERVIRRYPQSKKLYDEYVSDIITSNRHEVMKKAEADAEYTKPVSITEAAALRMTDKYAYRLKLEIEAVESVYDSLRKEEQKLMRRRYWSDRKRNIPFTRLSDISYSETQMRRICYKIIYNVGRKIGEINYDN